MKLEKTDKQLKEKGGIREGSTRSGIGVASSGGSCLKIYAPRAEKDCENKSGKKMKY